MSSIQVDPKILKNGEIRKLRADEELIQVDGVLTIKRKKKTSKTKEKKPKVTDVAPVSYYPEEDDDEQAGKFDQFVAPSRKQTPNKIKHGSQVKAAGVNLFEDDRTLSTNLIADSLAHAKIPKNLTNKRPPAKVNYVSVTCHACSRTYSIPDYLAPKGDPNREDDQNSAFYRCDKCCAR